MQAGRSFVTLVFVAIGSLVALPAATLYTIDSGHTSVVFSAKRQGVVNVYGRFNQIEGSVNFDETDPTSSSIQLTIDASSVDTNNERRDNHLRSPDFFNAQQFSEIRFQSTSVRKLAEDRYEVEGELTLHGVTRPIRAEVVQTGSGENARRGTKSIGFETHFVVKRSEFDMNYMQDALSDDIQITLAIHGVHRPSE